MSGERPRGELLHPLHATLLASSLTGALAWRLLPPLGIHWLPLALGLLAWPNARRSLGTMRLVLGGALLLLLAQGPGGADSPSPALPHPWGKAPPRMDALLVKELELAATGLEGLGEALRPGDTDAMAAPAILAHGWWHNAEGWHPLPGRLDLWPHRRRAPAWERDRWHLLLPRKGDSLILEQAATALGPYMPSPRLLAWQRGKVGRLRLDTLALRALPIGPAAPAPSCVVEGVDALRSWCARRLLEGSGEGGPWMVAILLGGQELLPADEVTLWQDAGLAHLLAVSGLNTGVLALALTQVLAPLPLRRAWRDGLLVLLLLLYVPLAGWQVSVKRAVGMALVLVIGRGLERPQTGLGALALVASLLLWRDPAELGHPGFLLSCGAVAALLLGMNAQKDSAPASSTSQIRAALAAVWRAITEALRISVVAQLGTVAVLLAFFGKVPLGGILLNVVAVPLSSVLTVAAFLHLVLPLPFEPLGALCGALAHTITWCAAHMPMLSLEWDCHPLQLALLALSCALLLLPMQQRARLLRVTLALLGLVAAADLLPRLATPQSWLCLFNAGQGDAILLCSPSGKGVLVDAGWEDPRGEGQRGARLSQACARLLPEAPHWMVLTHPDQDHLGGAMGFLRAQAVCSLLWNGEWKRNPPQDRLRHWLDKAGPPRVEARPGLLLQAEQGWRVRVLGPSAPSPGVEGNERSVVIRVESPQGAILLTGDAGHHQEAWLAAWGPFLAARWIKLGHHGSRGSSSPDFLGRAGAREAWISCGKGNRYGHPHNEVLALVDALGMRLHRSDQDGWRWLPLDGKPGPRRAWPRPRLVHAKAAGRAPPS